MLIALIEAGKPLGRFFENFFFPDDIAAISLWCPIFMVSVYRNLRPVKELFSLPGCHWVSQRRF
jgi:hypothetical protein